MPVLSANPRTRRASRTGRRSILALDVTPAAHRRRSAGAHGSAQGNIWVTWGMATKRTAARLPAERPVPKRPPKKAPHAASMQKVKARVAADDPLSAQRVRYLTEVFSLTQLAKLIGVSASQTSRWASGEERPGPAAAPVLIDLEHVLARARLVWGGDSARIWMESANAFLNAARPLDVVRTDGPARVLEALDAEMWGGAA